MGVRPGCQPSFSRQGEYSNRHSQDAKSLPNGFGVEAWARGVAPADLFSLKTRKITGKSGNIQNRDKEMTLDAQDAPDDKAQEENEIRNHNNFRGFPPRGMRHPPLG